MPTSTETGQANSCASLATGSLFRSCGFSSSTWETDASGLGSTGLAMGFARFRAGASGWGVTAVGSVSPAGGTTARGRRPWGCFAPASGDAGCGAVRGAASDVGGEEDAGCDSPGVKRFFRRGRCAGRVVSGGVPAAGVAAGGAGCEVAGRGVCFGDRWAGRLVGVSRGAGCCGVDGGGVAAGLGAGADGLGAR